MTVTRSRSVTWMSPASLLEVVVPALLDELTLAENSLDCWSSLVRRDRNRNRVVGGTESMKPEQVEWNVPIWSERFDKSTFERLALSRLATSRLDSNRWETLRMESRSGSVVMTSPFFVDDVIDSLFDEIQFHFRKSGITIWKEKEEARVRKIKWKFQHWTIAFGRICKPWNLIDYS